MKSLKLTVLVLGVLVLLAEIHGAKVKTGNKKNNKSSSSTGLKKDGDNSSDESSSTESTKSESREYQTKKTANDSSTAPSKNSRSGLHLSQLSKPGSLTHIPGHGGHGGGHGGGGHGHGGEGQQQKYVPPHYGAPHSPHLSGGPPPPPPHKNLQQGGGGGWQGGNMNFDLGGNGGWNSIVEKAVIVIGGGILFVLVLTCLSAWGGGRGVTHKMGKKSDDDKNADRPSDKADHVQLIVKVNEALERKY